jgi:hypothetical protein
MGGKLHPHLHPAGFRCLRVLTGHRPSSVCRFWGGFQGGFQVPAGFGASFGAGFRCPWVSRPKILVHGYKRVPNGDPRVRIETHTDARCHPRSGAGAPMGVNLDPHPTGAKPTGDPPRGCRLPSLVTPFPSQSSQAPCIFLLIGFLLSNIYLMLCLCTQV